MVSVTLDDLAEKKLFDQSNNYYFRLVQWSPDGSCFISSANDCKLRLFDLPSNLPFEKTSSQSVNDVNQVENEANNVNNQVNTTEESSNLPIELNESLVIKHSDALYDLSWYPYMSSNDPSTCVFALTSSNCSIHLYDAYTGTIRGTYKSVDHLEQYISAHSINFNPSGEKIYAGFRKGILRIFDTSSPGSDCQIVSTYRKYFITLELYSFPFLC